MQPNNDSVSVLNHLSNSCPDPHTASLATPDAENNTPTALLASEHSPGLAGGDCRKAIMELLDNAVMSVFSDH